MPEIRYVTEHIGDTINKIPYEVSDEEIEAEIEAEAREIAIRKIAEKEKPAIRARRALLPRGNAGS